MARTKKPEQAPAQKDTRQGDRHRPGYWKEYGRRRRAEKKAAQASSSEAVK